MSSINLIFKDYNNKRENIEITKDLKIHVNKKRKKKHFTIK